MCRNAHGPKKEEGEVAAVAASSLDSFVSQRHSKWLGWRWRESGELEREGESAKRRDSFHSNSSPPKYREGEKTTVQRWTMPQFVYYGRLLHGQLETTKPWNGHLWTNWCQFNKVRTWKMWYIQCIQSGPVWMNFGGNFLCSQTSQLDSSGFFKYSGREAVKPESWKV